MMSNFFDHINIDLQNTRIPDGMAADLSAFCDQYEQQITNWGGIDLQLLGIGSMVISVLMNRHPFSHKTHWPILLKVHAKPITVF